MSINKNALMRYKILDNCFRNTGRRYFIDDLIAECNSVLTSINADYEGISRRQIFDDIAFMESVDGWEIDLERVRVGKKVYYRYADSSFSINNMPLNAVEIDHLQSALDILSQFKGMPQFEWVHELIPKLQQDVTVDKNIASIIEFDSNQYLKGIEYLGVLYNAVRFKQVLKIQYRPFESTSFSELTIHPYYLKQYNNRWFLFGLNQDRAKSDWNLALDRIEKIEEAKQKYIPNREIKWLEYFDDIVGVTKPDNSKVEEIVLHFFGKTANYIASKPLHGSQRVKWLPEKILEVRLELIINYEFEHLILSYADAVKVISPGAFKEQILSRLTSSIHRYEANY